MFNNKDSKTCCVNTHYHIIQLDIYNPPQDVNTCCKRFTLQLIKLSLALAKRNSRKRLQVISRSIYQSEIHECVDYNLRILFVRILILVILIMLRIVGIHHMLSVEYIGKLRSAIFYSTNLKYVSFVSCQSTP